MKYISVKDAAVKWHVSQEKVLNWCQNGLIAGAKRGENSFSTWVIPEGAEKPNIGSSNTSSSMLSVNLRQQIQNELNEDLPKIRAKIDSLLRARNNDNSDIVQPEIDHFIAHEKWIKSMLEKC